MIKTRADLFEAAAKMMRMCDAAGIRHVWKWNGNKVQGGTVLLHLDIDSYEFPLAIVEGNPVFVGDELYDLYGHKWQANQYIFGDTSMLSWNPPKPATVMVELSRKTAERLTQPYNCVDINELSEACCKALEK